jgi:DNA-binding beta-propeller fold protein YncE
MNDRIAGAVPQSCRRRARPARRASGVAVAVALAALAPVHASADEPEVRFFARHELTLLPQEDSPFREPQGVSTDPFGGVFVADTGNHRVLQFSPRGELVFEFGGYGWEEGRLSGPTDLSAREGFRLFVVDAGNERIQSFSITDASADGTVFPFGAGSGFRGEELVRPDYMDVDAEGRIYVSDGLCHCVWIFAPTGELVLKLGGLGKADTRFDRPSGVAVADQGRDVYVADSGNRRIQIFDAIGNWRASWGGPDSDLLVEPTGIDLDASGNVYVADAGAARILVFTPEGFPLFSFGGPGDGPGSFRIPVDVAVGPDGRVWIADSGREVVEAYRIERVADGEP